MGGGCAGVVEYVPVMGDSRVYYCRPCGKRADLCVCKPAEGDGHRKIREDFGFECRYYPVEDRLVWAASNGIQISVSRAGGVKLQADATLHSLDSLRKLLLLAESIHRQLTLNDDTVTGGLWFGEEFWPWGWIKDGKPVGRIREEA